MKYGFNFIFLFCISLGLSVPLVAQDTTKLQQAIALSQQDNYKQADQLFQSLLKKEPSNVNILVASGYNHAWNKHFNQAEKEFNKALSLEPLNNDAAIGLGYTYSWGHKYSDADAQFTTVLNRSADNRDGLKGKAYNNLWRRKYRQAEADFNSLIRIYGVTSEYFKGKAAIYIEEGKTAKARELLKMEKASFIEKDQKIVAAKIQSAPGFVEFTPVIGYSKIAEESSFGLRSMEIALNPTPANRYWFRFDNSLGQDVLSIINNEIPTYALFAGTAIGSKRDINTTYTTIEGGYRKLNNEKLSQLSLRAEEVLVLPTSFAFKIGAMYAPRNDKTRETLLYGGVGIPITESFNIQPTYFITMGNVDKGRDSRIMVQGNYKAQRGAELTSGVIVGQTKSEQKLTGLKVSKTVFSVFSLVNIPVLKRHWIQPLIRYEKIKDRDLLNIVIGYKFRIEH